MLFFSILGYEWIALSWVKWVDVTVCVVEGAVPQVLGQLEGHLPLRKRHFLPVPYVHLTAKVKHQNLQQETDGESIFLWPLGGTKVKHFKNMMMV